MQALRATGWSAADCVLYDEERKPCPVWLTSYDVDSGLEVLSPDMTELFAPEEGPSHCSVRPEGHPDQLGLHRVDRNGSVFESFTKTWCKRPGPRLPHTSVGTLEAELDAFRFEPDVPGEVQAGPSVSFEKWADGRWIDICPLDRAVTPGEISWSSSRSTRRSAGSVGAKMAVFADARLRPTR